MEIKRSFGLFQKLVELNIKIKVAAVAVVLGILGIVGVGIYNGKTRAATADGATVSVTAGSGIDYGYYEEGGYAWMTTHFTVAGQSGMCLEPNLSTPGGSGTAHKLDRNDYKEMIQVMLVTDPSYNSTVYNAFKAAYPNIWANIAAKDLGGSGISGAGYADQAFVYGHAILGAMFKGMFQPAYYSETYFALNYWDGYHEVDLTSDLNSARSTIKKWFNSNYPTTYSSYQPYYMNIGTGSQAIGWLEPETAQARVRKVDESGNALTGAKFTLYKVVDGEYSKVQSGITTGDDGYSGYITVEPGYAYCFSETTTPTGYVTAEDGCTDVLDVNGKKTVKMVNAAEIVTAAGIKINKRDADHNNATPSGGAILDGAKFRVYSIAVSDYENICGTDAKCTTGELSPVADGRFTKTYTIAAGDTSVSTGKVLDAGAYCVTETAVGTGYIKNADIQCAKIDEGSTATISFTFKNTVKKGGVKIKKTKTISGETTAMEGVTFTITSACDSSFSMTLGPTDANGEASTSATALPYCSKAQGGYTLHEETTAGVNEGYALAGDKTFAITTNNKIVTVDTAGNDLTFNNTMSTPTMTSAATASDGSKTVSISDSVTISDKVTLKKLTSGQTYRVRGRVRETVSKTAVGSEQFSQWTQGTGTSATRTLTFPGLDVGSYVGKKLSVALILEVQNGSDWTTVITHNDDLTQASQTVTVESQSITSKAAAKNPVDGDKLAVGDVTLVDTVTIKGLAEGTTYKIYAAVYDGSGSKKLGEKEENYTMSASTGTAVDVPIEISFDSTDSFGGSVAVYVELRDTGGNVLAKHNDNFSDANQKVNVTTPSIRTTATGLNGSKIIAQGQMTIKDVVSYEGLVANHSYILIGSVNLVHNGTVTKIGEDKEVTVTATGYSGTFPAIEFTFDASSFQEGDKVVVFEKLMDTSKTYYLDTHEDVNDDGQTVTVQGVDLRTTATVGGNKTTGVGGVVTISDTIQMEGLAVGTSYQLRGWLTDASGTKIGDTVTDTFEATAENMSRMVEFVVNTDDYVGKAVTVFEELYINGQTTPIATHKTTGDTEQTVTIKTPTVGTTATATGSTSHDLNVGTVSVTDRIVYDGLIAGEKYTLVGTMMVKTDSGVEVLKINGQEVRVTSPEFTAGTDGAGSYDMVFEFSTLDIQGKDLVVYEKLLHSGKEIKHHEDPSDPGQTLKVKTASMGTKAVDGNESGSAADDVIEPEVAQKIKDTVSYFGLTPGKEYTLSGRLMDKSTGEVLKIDGTPVETKTMKFTAGADGSGEVVMTFELNATTLPGAEIVVFEKIIDVETPILTHEDIDDENQHILVRPRIGTEAVDEYDGNHFVGVGEVDVVDTVKYEGLVQGKRYIMVGTLVDKATGKAVSSLGRVHSEECLATIEEEADGHEETTSESSSSSEDAEGGTTEETAEGTVAASCILKQDAVKGRTEFKIGDAKTPESDGTVTIKFSFNAKDLVGKELVVFERVYEADGFNEETSEPVAVHEDLTDESQFIGILDPSIATQAWDKVDGDVEVASSGSVTIVDKVSYKGLAAGTKYTLKGVLMDKETGKRLGIEGDEAEYSFIAKGEEGYEQIEFTLKEVKDLQGKSIVVFETLYTEDFKENEDGTYTPEDQEVAKHEDINDVAQTITVKIDTPNTGRVTRNEDGAGKAVLFGGVAAVVVLGGVGAFFGTRLYKKRKMSL